MARRSKAQSKPATVKLDPNRVRTPKGLCTWAYLGEPVEDLNGKLQHKVTMFFDKTTDEFKDFQKTVNAMRKQTADELGVNVKQVDSPIKPVTEKMVSSLDGKLDVKKGQPYCEFKTQAEEGDTVKCVGADGKTEIDGGDVWGGSLIRVAAGCAGWQFGGKQGVKLYLNAVQVLELGGGKGGGTDLFEDESDDYETPEGDEDGDEEEFEDEEDFADESDEDEDDLPF